MNMTKLQDLTREHMRYANQEFHMSFLYTVQSLVAQNEEMTCQIPDLIVYKQECPCYVQILHYSNSTKCKTNVGYS